MKLTNLSLVSVLLATSAIAQTLPEMDELSSRLGVYERGAQTAEDLDPMKQFFNSHHP